jgi:hypothetical protein
MTEPPLSPISGCPSASSELVLGNQAPWEPPDWLAAWVPAEAVPVSLAAIERAIAAAQAALRPIARDALAAGLSRLMLVASPPVSSPHYPAMRARLDRWWDEARPVYVDVLADLPPDLVVAACRSLMQTETYMPKPADIRRHAESGLLARQIALRKLQIAHRKLTQAAMPAKPHKPLSEAEKRQIEEFLERRQRERDEGPTQA